MGLRELLIEGAKMTLLCTTLGAVGGFLIEPGDHANIALYVSTWAVSVPIIQTLFPANPMDKTIPYSQRFRTAMKENFVPLLVGNTAGLYGMHALMQYFQ